MIQLNEAPSCFGSKRIMQVIRYHDSNMTWALPHNDAVDRAFYKKTNML